MLGLGPELGGLLPWQRLRLNQRLRLQPHQLLPPQHLRYRKWLTGQRWASRSHRGSPASLLPLAELELGQVQGLDQLQNHLNYYQSLHQSRHHHVRLGLHQ